MEEKRVKENRMRTWTNEPLCERNRTLRATWILRERKWGGGSFASAESSLVMGYKHTYIGTVGSVRIDYRGESTN